MKILITIIVAVLIVLGVTWFVDVDTSGDIELPEVAADVDVSGGELPEVDVDTADIDVGTGTATIDVPSDVDVDVETREQELSYPTIDIESPEENVTPEQDDMEAEIDNDPANQR